MLEPRPCRTIIRYCVSVVSPQECSHDASHYHKELEVCLTCESQAGKEHAARFLAGGMVCDGPAVGAPKCVAGKATYDSGKGPEPCQFCPWPWVFQTAKSINRNPWDEPGYDAAYWQANGILEAIVFYEGEWSFSPQHYYVDWAIEKSARHGGPDFIDSPFA